MKDAIGLGPLQLDCAAEYVLGFPMHVAVTVEACRPQLALRHLPYVTPFSSAGGIGAILTRDGRNVVHLRPFASCGFGSTTPEFHLGRGERRRMLADLSEILPPLPAGTYELTVSYGSLLLAADSTPVTVVLRDPDASQRELLAARARDLARAGSWGLWTFLPSQPAPLPPDNPADPARFNLLMRYYFHGAEPLGIDDLGLLAMLDGVYAPEAAVLEAELLHLLRDQAGYAAAAARVRSEHPALAWRIEELDEGRTAIGWERRHR